MNWNEATHTLAVLGPIFGAVSTVLGVLVWVLKSHIQSKNEQIEQLRLEKKSLEADVAKEEANAQRHEYERDEAVRKKEEAERAVAPLIRENAEFTSKIERVERELAATKIEAEKYKSDAEKYLTAGQSEHKKRKDAETRADKAEVEAKSAREQAKKIETDVKLATERAEKRIRDAELSTRTAIDQKNAADKRARDAAAEAERQRAIAASLEKQIEAVANQDGRIWQAPLRPGTPTFQPLANRSTPVISLMNLKGGVGKTTLTANIAGYLSEHLEKRVLVIDLDHQRSLSQLLLSPKERELAADAGHTIQRFFRDQNKDGKALLDCSRPVPNLSNVRIITNSDRMIGTGDGEPQSLDDLEMKLMSQWLIMPRAADVRFLLLPALQSQTIRSQFDYVLIDCPPRLTTACVNALAGSDYLLIPTQPEQVALTSVSHLIRRLIPLRECGLVPQLKILGIVANMVRTGGVSEDSHERDLLATATKTASELWGREIRCFEAIMRRNDRYTEVTRFLQVGEDLKLAIHYQAVRDDITELTEEIRSIVDHESSNATAVPS